MANKYTKTLVLKTTGGDVTLVGGKAQAVQNRLDNDARFIHFTNPNNEHQEDYYNIKSSACGACLFATVTSGVTTVADKVCEEALMACAPEITSITPATAGTAGGETITLKVTHIDTAAIVLVGGAVVAGTVNVAAGTITFTAPAHAAGAVLVSVVDGGKQSNEVTLTYAAAS